MIEFIGWASSLILLATLVRQVRKQWIDKTSDGISKWLFVGQLTASIGFTVYSVATGSWVFAFTNFALTINNIIGVCLYITLRNNNGLRRLLAESVRPVFGAPYRRNEMKEDLSVFERTYTSSYDCCNHSQP